MPTARHMALMLGLEKRAHKAADDFIRQVARMTLPGECPSCGRPGTKRVRDCDEHEAFVQHPDDAVLLVSALIERARKIRGGQL